MSIVRVFSSKHSEIAQSLKSKQLYLFNNGEIDRLNFGCDIKR